MKIRRETCVAGAVIDQTIKGSYISGGCRRAKCNPTPEVVQKHNARVAAKNLSRTLNANFYPGDYHLVLTYAGTEPTKAEAEKEKKNFLRRMSREFKKINSEVKWVAVTEFKNHRIHHHIVMNYIPIEIIQKQWKRGMVRVTPLDRNRDYTKLAEYLVKETEKTFRDPDNATKQRWSASRNLVKPIIKREWVSEKQLESDPKALKGYALVEESIKRFEHPFTGLEHLEFRMVSTDFSPRIKKWRKGKIIDRQETYHRAMAMKQLELDFTNERSEWIM